MGEAGHHELVDEELHRVAGGRPVGSDPPEDEVPAASPQSSSVIADSTISPRSTACCSTCCIRAFALVEELVLAGLR